MIDEEKVIFDNQAGERLTGILSMVNDQAPIVIIAHGLGSSKDGGTYLGLQHGLNTHGISTFRFDFYGHGESEGKFENITLSEGVADVEAAYQYLNNKFKHIPIALCGSSFGGSAAFYAAANLDVTSIALICPNLYYAKNRKRRLKSAGMKAWKEKGFAPFVTYAGQKRKLAYTFFEDLKNFNPEKVKVKRLAFFHGEKDAIVPFSDSEKLAKHFRAKLKKYKGAGHNFDAQGEKDALIHDVVAHFIDILGTDEEHAHRLY